MRFEDERVCAGYRCCVYGEQYSCRLCPQTTIFPRRRTPTIPAPLRAGHIIVHIRVLRRWHCREWDMLIFAREFVDEDALRKNFVQRTMFVDWKLYCRRCFNFAIRYVLGYVVHCVVLNVLIVVQEVLRHLQRNRSSSQILRTISAALASRRFIQHISSENSR